MACGGQGERGNGMTKRKQSDDERGGRRTGVAQIASLPKLLLVGIDSLYCGFFTDGMGVDWEALAIAKETARAERKPSIRFVLGGVQWALSASGAYPYTYCLSNDRCKLRLAEHMQPNMHAQFLSVGLWDIGPKECLRELRSMFEVIGLRETRPASVSRVDWSFDFALGEPEFSEEHFLSKLRKDSKHRGDGKVETFTFGKGDLVVRVYDKVKEITEQSGKVWLFDLWGQKEGVWRIEVQARREFLKQHGIRSPDDLFKHQGHVARWVLEQHTTLRVPTQDSNRSRWPLHPLWRAVQAATYELEGQQQGFPLDLERPLTVALDASIKSVGGMLRNIASLVALMNANDNDGHNDRDKEEGPVPDLEQTLEVVRRRIARGSDPLMWENDVKTRRDKRRFGA